MLPSELPSLTDVVHEPRADARVSGAGSDDLPYELLHAWADDTRGSLWSARRTGAPAGAPGQDVLLRIVPIGVADNAVRRGFAERMQPVLALSHPNILRLREWGFDAPWPQVAASGTIATLVHDPFEGLSLAQWLRQEASMPVRQAVVLMLGVLDALVDAHGAGVLHRGLRPDVVWLDATGRPRVLDFGLTPDGPQALAAQEPGAIYLAPEVIMGSPAQPQSDVFAAALIMYELLTGHPAVNEQNPQRAFARLVDLDVLLPRPGPRGLDDGLRGIVQQALLRDPQRRTANAQAMRDALQRWLTPTLDEQGADSKAAQTMALLMRRIDAAELPARIDSVREIRRLAAADKANAGQLARTAREDVAFCLRLLRQISAAYYSPYHQGVGDGGVNTVSRTIQLMGFSAIRDLAGAMSTLDQLQPASRAATLAQEYRRAQLAGLLAARLCATALEEEETQIAATLQCLGRILLACYLPEEAAQIRQLSVARKLPLDRCAQQVLGWELSELGLSVAQTWGLSEDLVRAMRPLPAQAVVRTPERRGDWIRALASLGNELAEAMVQGPPRQRAARITAVADRYHHALGVSSADVWTAVDAYAGMAPSTTESGAAGSHASATAPAPMDGEATAQRLSQAILVVRAMADDDAGRVEPEAVLREVGQAMMDALPCRHVVLCLRRSRSDRIVAREAFGADRRQLLQYFSFDLTEAADVFSAVCSRGADTLIKDTSVPTIAARLPLWFQTHVKASSFLLLPWVTRRGGMETPIGAIYAGTDDSEGLTLSDRDLSLLRSLRDESLRALTVATRPFGSTRF